MVERSLSCLERQIPLETERRSVDRDRCLQPRLGCMLQWGKNRGTFVSSGTPSAHKLLRVNGGRFCNKILLQKQGLNPSKVVDGQYHCHSVHKPNGRLIPCVSQSSLRDLAMVPPERDLHHSTAHSWHLQQCGRQGIQSGQRFVRLETRPNSLCSPQRAVGSIRGGFVCDTAYKSASQVCELETRSRGRSDRRFLSGLVSDKGLRIPPFQSGRSLPIPSARTGYPTSVSYSPSMGDAALVPSTVTSERRFSTPLPNRPRASQQGEVTSPSPPASTSRVACLSQRYTSIRISNQAQGLLVPPGETRPLAPMCQPSFYGVAGAVNKRLIPFLPLFSS